MTEPDREKAADAAIKVLEDEFEGTLLMEDVGKVAIAAYEAELARQGFVVVPKEPTRAMCDAGEGYNIRCGCPDCDHAAWHVADGYRAMLATQGGRIIKSPAR